MAAKHPPPDRAVVGAIAFLRDNWRSNDGAEGESVKLVCDELERLRDVGVIERMQRYTAAIERLACHLESRQEKAERPSPIEAEAFVDQALRVLRAPVTGDRLLASLACHIDHDEPPGLAARELATVVLELLDGADGVEAVILAVKLRGLVEQRKVGARG